MKHLFVFTLLITLSFNVGAQFLETEAQPNKAENTIYADMADNIWNWHETSNKAQVAENQEGLEPEANTVELPALPVYKQLNTEELGSRISDYNSELNEADSVDLEGGREADASLKKLSSGVAVVDLKTNGWSPKSNKLKDLLANIPNIEVVDIGEEPRVSARQMVGKDLSVPNFIYGEARSLKTPNSDEIFANAAQVLQKRSPRIGKVRRLKGKRWELGKIVSLDEVNSVETPITEVAEYSPKPVTEVTKFDIFLLSAIILYQKERYPVAMGLFDQVSKDKKHREEANFYLGLTANKLKLFSESVQRLTPIVKANNIDYLKEAIEALTADLPEEYEMTVAESLKSVKAADYLPEDLKDIINYQLSRMSFKKDKYKSARTYASFLKEGGELYPKARYISAISDYMIGDVKSSEKKLEDLKTYVQTEKVKDNNLKNLIAVNLGRMHFHNKEAAKSYKSYKDIDKNHPLWMEALIEQGWVQLYLNDTAGSIGNMYSIHSPYFKSVFMPESFAIRSIGYLNLCQYGDSYKSLTTLEKTYKPWKQSLDSYLAKSKPGDAYKTVSKYLTGNSQTNVDGLAFQVIREAARNKNFLNMQKSINEKLDEIKIYRGLQNRIVMDRKNTKNRLASAKQKLRNLVARIKSRTVGSNRTPAQLDDIKSSLKSQKEYVISYAFQDNLIKQSYRNYKKMKSKTLPRVEKEMAGLRQASAQTLFNNFKSSQKQLDTVLNNNEFLRYETFAGSGENIRYIVTGGKSKGTNNRIPASIKPKKMLNWDFAGEFWEDEIGSYRSTITNNCPENLADKAQ